MKNGVERISLQVPSVIGYLDLLQGVAEEVAQLAGLDEDGRLDLGLAVRELAVNAMKHAHGFDASLPVKLSVEMKPDAIRVTVLDEGPGFDPAATPDPTAPENIWRTSGRGLLLIRGLVDGLEYRRRQEGGMECTLVKQRPVIQPAQESLS